MAIPEGWDSILKNENNEEPEEIRKQRLQLNKDFVSTFSTEQGMRVIDYFKSHTLDKPSWVPGTVEGQAQWREGQNSIIREIEYRISDKNKQES